MAGGTGFHLGFNVLDVLSIIASGTYVPLKGAFLVHCNMPGSAVIALPSSNVETDDMFWILLQEYSDFMTQSPIISALEFLANFYKYGNTPGWIALEPGENVLLQSTIAKIMIPSSLPSTC